MADEQDAASKTEEATPQKLAKAREKGDVAKTPDLAMLASFAGAAAVIAIAGGWMSRNLAADLLPFIAHPDSMNLEGHGAIEVARHAARAAAPILLAVMLVAAVMGAAGNLVQTGLMFSPEKIKPDWKKVSPLGGLKRTLGPDGLMQFFKSLVKIVMVGWVGWVVMKPYIHPLKELAALDPAAMLPLMVGMSWKTKCRSERNHSRYWPTARSPAIPSLICRASLNLRGRLHNAQPTIKAAKIVIPHGLGSVG